MSEVTTHAMEQGLAERGVTMRSRVRALIAVGSIVAAPAVLAPATAHAATPAAAARRRKTVASGETWEVAAGATFHLRQGVYAGADGVVADNSVLSSVRG